MGANFTPVFNPYSGQGAFRYWCQTVLPLVYDDSLSYYELLNKMVVYLNNTIEDVKTVEDNLDATKDAFVSLQSWTNEHVGAVEELVAEMQEFMNTYFDNLDVQNEINNKLDEMAGDGSLSAILAPILAEDIPGAVTSWLNENVTPVGSAVVVDSTLSISGAAADAKATGDSLAESLHHLSSSSVNNYNDFFGIPLNSYFTITGAKILELDSSFPYELVSSNSYNVSVVPYASYRKITIENSSGIKLFTGYSSVLHPDSFTWNNISYEALDNELDELSTKSLTYVAYSDVASFSDFLTIPVNTFFSISGSKILELDSNFPFDVASGSSYFAAITQLAESYRIVDIISLSGKTHYRGYTAVTHPDSITWFDISTKNLIDNVQNNAFLYIADSVAANYNSLLDAPVNSYFNMSGSKIKEIEPDFPFDITNNLKFVFVYKYATNYKMIRIMNLTGEQLFTGYNSSAHPDSLTWIDNSYENLNQSVTTLNNEIEKLYEYTDNIFECYSDFETESYWWTSSGGFTNASLNHTQKFRIRPNTDYYCGHLSMSTACIGAFFDKQGNWIAPLLNSDVTLIEPDYEGGENKYVPDNYGFDEEGRPTIEASSYITIYKFTSPANAYYFSLNCVGATNQYRYRQAICSKEIYMLNGSGNFCIKEGDPLYQKNKDKKLCIIGPSNVMINRLYRTRTNSGDITRYVVKNQTSGFITGFQEFLKPYFNEVKSFGYSGASMATGRGSATGQCSIYTRICGGTESFTYEEENFSYSSEGSTPNVVVPDLSGYDVFLIWSDGNGLTASTVGEYTDQSADSYMGSLRAICDKIQEQNPLARIFLATFQTAISTGDRRITRENVNNQIRLLADEKAYGLVEFKNEGISTVNFNILSYDGTHKNCEGNRLNGETVRKFIVGF